MAQQVFEELEDYQRISDDSSSGAESFCSEDETYYRQNLDPVEDQKPEEGVPGRSHISSSRSSSSRRMSAGALAASASWTSNRDDSRPPQAHPTAWKTADDPDTAPNPLEFLPQRQPGHQLNSSVEYTPLDLFTLFIDSSTIANLCSNINKQAAKNIANGKPYTWTTLHETEFYRFLGLTFMFGPVHFRDFLENWDVPLSSRHPPDELMSWERYNTIACNIHLSDPDQDVENDKKREMAQHDHLFRLRPLMDTLSAACKTHYHPRQNISITERTAISTTLSATLASYEREHPRKWAFKLFVLCDSSNGYFVDFVIYTGKSQFPPGVGLPYDSVMSLVKPLFLGSGYNVFMSDFHSSPKLFRDLYAMKIRACGVYWRSRHGCPRTQTNALQKRDPRGTIRWIRDDPLVFVLWKDSGIVPFCSTIHPAYTGDTIVRRVRGDDGTFVKRPVPCPKPVTEYNKYMVEENDLLKLFPCQLFQYYKDCYKNMRFYRALFYHFLDIAAANAYVLHKELLQERGQSPMTHCGFLVKLIDQLCEVTV